MGWGRPALLKRGLKEPPKTLWRLRGVPMVEVKTRPWSCQSPASFSRSSDWRSKWALSAFKAGAASYTSGTFLILLDRHDSDLVQHQVPRLGERVHDLLPDLPGVKPDFLLLLLELIPDLLVLHVLAELGIHPPR